MTTFFIEKWLLVAIPQLNPIPVKAHWYQVGIDFIGPISSMAEDESVYILTITDHFTKKVEAIFPLLTKMLHLFQVLYDDYITAAIYCSYYY